MISLRPADYRPNTEARELVQKYTAVGTEILSEADQQELADFNAPLPELDETQLAMEIATKAAELKRNALEAAALRALGNTAAR